MLSLWAHSSTFCNTITIDNETHVEFPKPAPEEFIYLTEDGKKMILMMTVKSKPKFAEPKSNAHNKLNMISVKNLQQDMEIATKAPIESGDLNMPGVISVTKMFFDCFPEDLLDKLHPLRNIQHTHVLVLEAKFPTLIHHRINRLSFSNIYFDGIPTFISIVGPRISLVMVNSVTPGPTPEPLL